MSTTISIDKAGRLILPKAIREKMHLDEHSRLSVQVVADKIELTPEANQAEIEEVDGLPVVTGWDGFDAARAVNDAREAYEEKLAGES